MSVILDINCSYRPMKSVENWIDFYAASFTSINQANSTTNVSDPVFIMPSVN